MTDIQDAQTLADTHGSLPPSILNLCSSADLCAHPCDSCRMRALGVCGAMQVSELHELESLLTQTVSPAKTVLFSQGDAATHVYSVTAGCVRLSKDMADGRRQIVGFALPGDFLGLALEPEFGFSADAVEPVSLCRFNRADFMQFLEKRPHVVKRLYEMAAHELTIAQDQMMLLGRMKAEERVAAFLVRWRDRMHRLTGADHTLHLPMTRQDMADYLGLTIETVSRTVSDFARRKLIIIVPDGVRILALNALRDIAT